MCELLVRIRDKISSDPYNNVKLTKRGDVIVCMPDGFVWSSEEITNPDWRILKWPSETEASASVLLSPEIQTANLAVPDPMLQVRGFYLDVDSSALPQDLVAYIADDARVNPYFSVPSYITITVLKKQRPKVPDPAVIG